jgi:acyl-coenzyme A synthetase/AMP-(fatty) acid ligase
MRFGDELVKKHDLSSLRILGSVGKPINPEAWRWYHEVVGGGRCAIVDTFWQTAWSLADDVRSLTLAQALGRPVRLPCSVIPTAVY